MSTAKSRKIFRAIQAADEPRCWVVIHDQVTDFLARAKRAPSTGDGICCCWSRGGGEKIAAALNSHNAAARKRRQRRLQL